MTTSLFFLLLALQSEAERSTPTTRLTLTHKVIAHRLEVEGVVVGICDVATPQREFVIALAKLHRCVKQRVEILLQGVCLVPVNLARTLPRGVECDVIQHSAVERNTIRCHSRRGMLWRIREIVARVVGHAIVELLKLGICVAIVTRHRKLIVWSPINR